MNASLRVSSFAGLSMDCACGRTHKVPIQKIITGSGVLGELAGVLESFKGASVFLAGDVNTMPLAGERVREMLREAGCAVTEHIFPERAHMDEHLMGSMLIRLKPGTQLIVTIGSGTLNDCSRVISARCGVPYIIIATAPSMDGYASSVSAVVVGNEKLSIPLGVPYGILADCSIMKTAPNEMISSGVFDIMGKFIALSDWRLAQRETGEYFCPYMAGLIYEAAQRCVAGIDASLAREEAAIQHMADTLIMSGVAISMHGTSRPASGCEHQLAHYWEVAAIKAAHGGVTPLHGNYVGLGTLVARRLYTLAGEEFDLAFDYPMPESADLNAYVKRLGGFASLETLAVPRDVFYESFFHATHANGRYTLVSFLTEKGRLAHYAKVLTDEFYN